MKITAIMKITVILLKLYTLNPKDFMHSLCAFINSTHDSSPFAITQSSLAFLVSGQAQHGLGLSMVEKIMSRPEHQNPPQIFYNTEEAIKYTKNSRIITIQNEMAERAYSLLALEKPSFILDIGCGSGLSGEILDEYGHYWVGLDISDSMLSVARDRMVVGDLFLQDIGHGVGFRPGTFDGVISISVIQWLCNADRQSHNPRKRLSLFFTTLYTAMARGARCIFQFYPENSAQIEMIVSSALKSGFSGGLVIDYPNSKKAKKYFLCLFAGLSPSETPKLPQGLDSSSNTAIFSQQR
jgi:18S rRNA (guanine1575-N7)-methyltransferase